MQAASSQPLEDSVETARGALGRRLDATARSERPWRLAVAAVVVLALGLALVRLGWRPFTYDERFTVTSVSYPPGGIWNLAQDTEAPHLAYYVLLKPWVVLFGTSHWAMRLPSVLFGALAVGATVLVGVRLFGQFAGIAAGLLLASNAYFVGWSQQARSYVLSAALAALATYAFVRAVELQTARRWAVWTVAMTAASWSSLFAASLLAAHVLAFFAHRPRLDRRVAAIALAAVAVCVTPIAVLVSSNGRDQLDWIPTPTVDVVRLGVWDWAGHNPVLLVAAAIGVIALVTWRRSSVESWKTVLVCSWLLAPFAATLALSTVQPSFVPRYLVSAAPPLALLAGVGVASLPRRLALVLAALLVAVAGLKLYRYYTVV